MIVCISSVNKVLPGYTFMSGIVWRSLFQQIRLDWLSHYPFSAVTEEKCTKSVLCFLSRDPFSMNPAVLAEISVPFFQLLLMKGTLKRGMYQNGDPFLHQSGLTGNASTLDPPNIINNDKNPEASTEKHVGIHVAGLHKRATMKTSVFF